MYPGTMHWWRSHHRGERHAFRSCDPMGRSHHGHESGWRSFRASGGDDDLGPAAFGVRRPLRFLAFKLDLDEDQVTELAAILNDLKTERAQAEVDGRRAVSAFADAVAGESFDGQRAAEGGTTRVRAAEHLRDAVQKALGRIHALLRPDQRQKLAYLIRTGTLRL